MNKVKIPYVKNIIQEDNLEKAIRDLKRVLQSLKVTSKEYDSIIKYLNTGERLMRQHTGKHKITHQMELETGNVGVNLLKSFNEGVGLSTIVRTKSNKNKLFRYFINLKEYDFSILHLVLKQAYYCLPYYEDEGTDRSFYKFRFDEVFKNKIEKAKELYFDIVTLERQIDDKKKEIMKIME